MALSNVYTIAGISAGGTIFKDIRDTTLSPNLQMALLGASGTAYQTFVAIAAMRPALDFSSGDLKTILAKLTNQIALAISGDFLIWFQKMAEGGVRSAGSTHTKGTVAKGLLIPVSISLRDGQDATITCQLLMTSADGSTSPLALTGSQALVAAAGAAAGWTLGPVSINGTALEGVEEVTINFGISPAVLGASGMIYPTFAGVMRVDPTISIVAASIDEFISWGLTGAAQGATDSTIYIQDMAEGGVRGSAPIICTVDEGMFVSDAVPAADGQHTRHRITLKPTYDGTALPLAWTGLS
jgi:hypothetical protein